MSCKCAKFHSFIIKGTIFTPNRWTMNRKVFSLKTLVGATRPGWRYCG